MAAAAALKAAARIGSASNWFKKYLSRNFKESYREY